MADDPFRPVAAAKRRAAPAKTGRGEVWTTLVPAPANAPAAPDHYQHGKPSRIETYRDAQGRLLGHVCRFDLADGAKVFLPLTYCRSGKGGLEWRWQSWPAPRPLFGLDRLAARANAPVVVAEGEKAAAAVEMLLPDHVGVTSPNGSLAAAAADWTALAGRRVIIWPDADEAGAKYAAAVVRLLAPIAGSVMVAAPPKGAAAGWDAADALAEGWDQARAADLIDGAADALAPKPPSTARSSSPRRGRGRPARAWSGDDGAEPETEERKPRPRQKDGLLAILKTVELWQSPDKIAHATIVVDGHHENHEVRARAFRFWLGHQFFQAHGAAVSKQAMEEALTHAESVAWFEGKEHEPFIRHGHSNGRLYLDLGDDKWRAIEIDGEDYRIVSRPPVKFIRSDYMLSLPEPVRPPPEAADIGPRLALELGEIIPVETGGDITLIVAWLLMTFHPKGPYPGLGFNGPDGSGKTSAGRLVKRILDPDRAPDRAPPRDELGLCAAARNSWVVALDNLSHVPGWLSDAMCRLATGAAISGRSLYTNADEFRYILKRPQITTGINKLADRADLAACWIQITMPRIVEEQRLDEEEFEAMVAERLPRVLGLLLTAVAGILGNPDARLARPPRMADFALWIERARPGLGWHEDKFSEAYEANRGSAGDAVIQNDALAQALIELLEQEHGHWQGSSTELIAALPVSEAVRRQKSFPAPNTLPDRLVRLTNTLARDRHRVRF